MSDEELQEVRTGAVDERAKAWKVIDDYIKGRCDSDCDYCRGE